MAPISATKVSKRTRRIDVSAFGPIQRQGSLACTRGVPARAALS
jgi:hypothetical protein